MPDPTPLRSVKRRPRPDEVQPSHLVILDAVRSLEGRMEAGDRSREDLSRRVDTQALVLQRIEGKIDDQKTVLGWVGVDQHGRLEGKGLAGEVGRIKERVDQLFAEKSKWRNLAIGFCAAASIFLAALWWLTSDKLGHLLK